MSGDFRLGAAVAASLCSPTEQERGRYGESAWKHQPSKYGGCRRPSAPVKRRFTPSTTFPSRSARTSSSRCCAPQIGRAHVRTPVTNTHLVCRPLLEKKNDFHLMHQHHKD